jgi:hypothetical protein
MATTVARLQAVLSANTKDFDRDMDKSHDRMGKVGKAAGAAGLAIAGGLAVGLTKSVRAAMDAEKSQVRLEQSFKRAKVSVAAHSKEIAKASARALQLGFDDEDLKDSLGSLVIATGSYKKAQADANVAMDVARFKGVSLEAGTKMLTMAMAGSQRAAKQLGLSVQAVTTEQDKAKRAFDQNKDAINKQFDALGKLTPAEKAAKDAALEHAKAQYEGAKATAQVMDKQVTAGKVIDLVKDKVKGQAQAYSETAAGGMERFKVGLEELEETIGATLLPILTKVINKLVLLLTEMQKHPKALKAMVIGLGALAAALITASIAQAALNLAVLANPYVAATIAIIALAAGVFLLYRRFTQLRPVIEFFLEWAAGVPLPLRVLLVALGGIHGTLEKLQPVIEKINGVFEKLVGWLKDAVRYAKDLVGWLGKIHAPKIDLNPFNGDSHDPTFVPPGLRGPTGGSGDLHGASEAMRPFANLGSAFGLHISAGRTDHSKYTKSGKVSDHWYGKALDMADGASSMAGFFRALIGNPRVKQAFYDPLGSIFGGALSSYREGGHSDHVHVATYDRGGYLKPGWNLAYNGTGAPEPVGGGTVNIYMPNYMGSEQAVFAALQQWGQKHVRRNGRRPF